MRQYWIRWFGWLIFWLCYGPLYWGGYNLIRRLMSTLSLEMIYLIVRAELFSLFLWGIGGIIGSILAGAILFDNSKFPSLASAVFWIIYWFCFLSVVAAMFMLKSPIMVVNVGHGYRSIMPIIIYGATGGVLGNFLIERVLKRHF